MPVRSQHRWIAVLLSCMAVVAFASCKRSDSPVEMVKSQKAAMDRAKEVGKTMQKGADAEGKKADEEGR